MQHKICGLSKENFHDVVTMAWRTIGNDHPNTYSRSAAEQFVKDAGNNIRVLEVNDEVFGAYGYHDVGNSYSLNFFMLKESARSKKVGYSLYRDMRDSLSGKITNIIVYNDNKDMISIVGKRAKHIGDINGPNGMVSYYSILFKDKVWK